MTAGHHTCAEKLVPAPPGQRKNKEDMDDDSQNITRMEELVPASTEQRQEKRQGRVSDGQAKGKMRVLLNAEERTSVYELDMMNAGITKVGTENQMLYKGHQCIEANESLTEYGFKASIAKAQAPATVRLAFRDPGSGKFETVVVTPPSSPPKLPDVMKTVT